MTGPSLAFPLPGSRIVLEASEPPGQTVIRRLADGAVIGKAAVIMDGATLHIAALAVDEAHRGYGAGTEAARLLLDAAETAGFGRITAWAPPHRGLATYFWYRMGLRAVPGPGPGGGILFERTLGVLRATGGGGTSGT